MPRSARTQRVRSAALVYARRMDRAHEEWEHALIPQIAWIAIARPHHLLRSARRGVTVASLGRCPEGQGEVTR